MVFALGGILKGATGAGAAIFAIPIIVVLYDVQTAVTIFVLPSLLSNVWQGWSHRKFLLKPGLVVQFILAGAVGAGIGTFMLKEISGDLLGLMVAAVMISYIAFRLLRPDWSLSREVALRIATPTGVAAGILQGATGISVPVSITFLNAMKIERREFVATIAVFFLAVSAVQLPLMIYFGLMTGERLQLSLFGFAALFAFMPVGAALGKRVSAEIFDKIILSLLALIAVKLAAGAAFSFFG